MQLRCFLLLVPFPKSHNRSNNNTNFPPHFVTRLSASDVTRNSACVCTKREAQAELFLARVGKSIMNLNIITLLSGTVNTLNRKKHEIRI